MYIQIYDTDIIGLSVPTHSGPSAPDRYKCSQVFLPLEKLTSPGIYDSPHFIPATCTA